MINIQKYLLFISLFNSYVFSSYECIKNENNLPLNINFSILSSQRSCMKFTRNINCNNSICCDVDAFILDLDINPSRIRFINNIFKIDNDVESYVESYYYNNRLRLFDIKYYTIICIDFSIPMEMTDLCDKGSCKFILSDIHRICCSEGNTRLENPPPPYPPPPYPPPPYPPPTYPTP